MLTSNNNIDIGVKIQYVCKEKGRITIFHNVVVRRMKRLRFVYDRMSYIELLRSLGCDITLLKAQFPDEVNLLKPTGYFTYHHV